MDYEDEQNDNTRSYSMLSAGTNIGRYRILEHIATGGMGEVYLAEDPELTRNVVLKFVPQQFADDPEAVARFRREAQAAAVLNHPNVVTIHEVGDYHGRPYIVMEHVGDRVLRDYLIGRDLTLNEFTSLAVQIAEGLQEAHNNGIIHRDLKPSNIVVDQQGRPKILDFGLASVRGGEPLTKTGSTMGTIGYMSPEQISGGEITEQSDLFSLGVIFYELLARRRPFTGDNEAAILNAVLKEKPPPLSQYRDDIPADLQRLIDRLLDKKSSFRPRSVTEVITELKRIFGEGAVARSSGGLTPVQRLLFVALPLAVLLALVIALMFMSGSTSEEESVAPVKPMIAVLPFENLGDPDDEYFADGMTEEITSRLAKIKGLGVISRTSAMQYKTTTKGLPEIATELGVQYVLEGTVRWDRTGDVDMVRITPQLIRTDQNTHLWVETYDRPLTSVFEVQGEIAKHIAGELNVTLLEKDRQAVEDVPTTNAEAYQAYLRGAEHSRDPDWRMEDFEIAIQMFTRATELDSLFVRAWAGLAITHLALYHQGYDRTDERRQMGHHAAQRALEIDPQWGAGHFAMAYYYYWGFKAYPQALRHLDLARTDLAGTARFHRLLGGILRRQGRFEDAVEEFKQAFELDPRDAILPMEVGITYYHLRQFDSAVVYERKSIAIRPDQQTAYGLIAHCHMLWNADLEKAKEALREAPHGLGRGAWHYWVQVYKWERNWDSAQAVLDSIAPVQNTEDLTTWYLGIELAAIPYYAGHVARARHVCDSLIPIYQQAQKEQTESISIQNTLAMLHAIQGNEEASCKYISRLDSLLPVRVDALSGVLVLYFKASCYAILNEEDSAIGILEELMRIPADFTVQSLRFDPVFDPLHDHPRFQALIKKYREQGKKSTVL